MKLNQFIALLKGGKSDGEGALTRAYHQIQKTPLLGAYWKGYKPRDEEGETLPAEGNVLQLRVPVIMADVVAPLTRLFDLTATVDAGNQMATANVKVDGVIILAEVPVSTLLYLERKLNDLKAFVDKLPVLDPAATWEPGDDGLSWKTVPTTKVRTKKTPRVLEKSPATDKHPAQVEVWYEDNVVGDWTTIEFSGAISAKRQRELATKVVKLQEAVKVAREEANMTEVPDVKIGEAIFDFLDWKGTE